VGTPAGPAETVRSVASLIDGSRYEVLPGAGHLVNLERPDAFNLLPTDP
jgi:pimeloyl-ACP methyl ester carboxylesterase